MLILTTLFIITAIGMVMMHRDDGSFWGFMILTFGCVLLFISIIALPVGHMETKSKILTFQAVEYTLNNSRISTLPEIERAAIQNQVIEVNKWLASIKYYNTTMLDIWIPDEVDELQPIK